MAYEQSAHIKVLQIASNLFLKKRAKYAKEHVRSSL